MFLDTFRTKSIAKQILKQHYKSERQMNISELGRTFDWNKIADAEDAGINTRRVKDPLQQHSWVNIAIDFRSRNLARCDYKIYNGEDEVTEGPVFELFNDVNPTMSQYQLWEATEAWRMVEGEALWVYTGRDQARLGQEELPIEIYVADPRKWKIVLNDRGTSILRWMWFPEEDQTQGIPYSNREIVHFKIWSKWDRWRGSNFWTAQTENIEQDVEANVSNTQLIKNKSVPPGILSSEQIIDDKTAKEMADRWDKNHKGAGKTGRIGITGKGAKYQPIAMSHSDMQYMEMKKWNRGTILAKAGIPPVLVGVKDDATPMSGTDTKEQQANFWNSTMFPEKKALEDKLRTDYFRRFGLQLRGEFSTEGIHELQEDFGKKVEKATKLFAMGFTQNEINEKLEMGFEEAEWGDVGYRPGSLKRASAEEELPPPMIPGNAPPPFLSLSAKQDRWITSYILESRNRWDSLEENYRAAIKKWLFAQRKYFLNRYGKSADQKTYEEFLYWAEQKEQLTNFSETYFFFAMDEVQRDLVTIFRKTGFNSEFEFFSADVNKVVNTRLQTLEGLANTTKNVIDKVIREGAQQGFEPGQMADMIRSKYVQLGKHADTIARTEMAIIKADAQQTAYAREGVQQIQWLHLGGGMTDRPDHVMNDGEVRLFGQEMFPTDAGGILYPHAPGGAAEDVINCYCDYIPVPQEA